MGALGRRKTCPVFAVWKGRILDKQARSCFSSTLTVLVKICFSDLPVALLPMSWTFAGRLVLQVGQHWVESAPSSPATLLWQPREVNYYKMCRAKMAKGWCPVLHQGFPLVTDPLHPFYWQRQPTAECRGMGEMWGMHDHDLSWSLLLLLHLL